MTAAWVRIGFATIYSFAIGIIHIQQSRLCTLIATRILCLHYNRQFHNANIRPLSSNRANNASLSRRSHLRLSSSRYHRKHGYNVTSLSMGSHTGTHLDAPYHFFDNGKKVHNLPLEDLVGPAVVLRADLAGDLGPRQRITWDDLVRLDPESFQKLEREALASS